MKRYKIVDKIFWILITIEGILCIPILIHEKWNNLSSFVILISNLGLWFHEKRNLDFKDEFYHLKKRKFEAYRFFITILLFSASIFIFLKTFDYLNFGKDELMKYSCIIMSILMIFIGNLISNIRPNGYLGIINFLTRKNLEVWKTTNKWSGKLIFFLGIISFLINSITPHNQLIFNQIERIHFIIVLCSIWIFCPFIYSLIIYFKSIKKTV